MVAVPMKPQYGPTLGQLLSPRWRAASPLARRAVIAAGVALVALLIGAALTLENARYSHGGKVPFAFSYRSLYRVAPDPGGFVKVQRHRADGALEDSFAVGPLRLPPYSGSLSGELPLYANSYIRGLPARHPQFVLRGEGKTKVNTIPAYAIAYTTVRAGAADVGTRPAAPTRTGASARRGGHRDADESDGELGRSTRRRKWGPRACC